MKFNLKHLLLAALLIAIFAALISASMRVDVDQTYASIAFSPDSKTVVVQGTFNTQVFGVARGKKMAELDVFSAETPEHVEFVDDQHILSFGFAHDGRPRAVRWHHWPTGRMIRHYEFTTLWEHFFPAHNGFLYANNLINEVRFYSSDPTKNLPLSKATYPSIFYSGLLHQNPNTHAFYNGTAAEIQAAGPFWPQKMLIENLEGSREMKSPADLGVNLRVSPAGGSFSSEFKTWFSYHERTTGKTRWAHKIRGVQRCRFSQNGNYVGVEDRVERNVYLFATDSGKQLLRLSTERDYMPIPFAISNDGKLVIARQMSSQGGLEVYDALAGRKLGEFGQTNSEARWIFVSLTFTAWLLAWSLAWVFVIPKSLTLTKLPRLVSTVYWLLIFVFGMILAFGTIGFLFKSIQTASRSNTFPGISAFLNPLALAGVAVLCLVLSLQRLLNRTRLHHTL